VAEKRRIRWCGARSLVSGALPYVENRPADQSAR
jgi:hypothetical protein